MILGISLFFDRFLEIAWVASAFRGIRVAVVYLILSAGLKMFKKMKKTPFSITVASLTLVSMTALSLFSVRFSSIFYILIFGALALTLYAIRQRRSAREVVRS